MISTWYPTITMIIEMTIQYLTAIHICDHPGKRWASDYQKIPSRQQLEPKSRQVDLILDRRYPNILRIGRSMLSQSRRMNASLSGWHARRYPITRLNDWIRLLMYIFHRGRIQTKLVSNWLHWKLEICGDISPLLTTQQASSSPQNTTPRPLF